MRFVSCLALFATLLLGFACAGGVRVNLTPSMPPGVYRLADGVPQRGDIVTFCLPDDKAVWALKRGYIGAGSCPFGTQPLLKYLAAVPGDRIEVSPESISVSAPSGPACLWPASPLSQDKSGRELVANVSSGVVPDDAALVLALHPGSFDGRYFGLVSFASLRRVEPLSGR